MDPANTKSYSGAGATWSDLSKSMNYGSLVGGFAISEDLIGGATPNLSFGVISATSTTSAWISTATTLSFTDTSEYSMEFAVKLRSNAQNLNSLCGNGQTNPWVGIAGTGSSWTFFFRDAGATYSYSATTTNYDISQKWAILAYTVASDRTIRFYLNGTFVSNTSPAPTTTLLNVSRLAGGYSSGGNSYPLQGFMSTARIYNKKLSDSEVLQNYNTTRSRFGL